MMCDSTEHGKFLQFILQTKYFVTSAYTYVKYMEIGSFWLKDEAD